MLFLFEFLDLIPKGEFPKSLAVLHLNKVVRFFSVVRKVRVWTTRHRKSWLFKGCLSGSQEMETLNFKADRSAKHGNFGMDGSLVKSLEGNLGGDAGIVVSRLQETGRQAPRWLLTYEGKRGKQMCRSKNGRAQQVPAG